MALGFSLPGMFRAAIGLRPATLFRREGNDFPALDNNSEAASPHHLYNLFPSGVQCVSYFCPALVHVHKRNPFESLTGSGLASSFLEATVSRLRERSRHLGTTSKGGLLRTDPKQRIPTSLETPIWSLKASHECSRLCQTESGSTF